MKLHFYILILLSATILTTISCNKEHPMPTPTQVDSVKKALPIQIIHTYRFDTSSAITTDVVSIKYDTTNFKIELYLDDTTNMNPYDDLAATYSYNSAGYITSYIASAGDYKVTISRATNNNIIYMAKVSQNAEETDSIFYTYLAVSGGTMITTVDKYYYQGTYQSVNTRIYNFTSDGRLLQADFSNYGIFTYSYNTNNSINNVSLQGATIDINEDYNYLSGLPDGNADIFAEVLTGRDYYLPDIKDLNPFIVSINFDFEVNALSVTDPYHVTAGHYQGTDAAGSQLNNGSWVYELNDQKKISKVTFIGDGGTPEVYMFKY